MSNFKIEGGKTPPSTPSYAHAQFFFTKETLIKMRQDVLSISTDQHWNVYSEAMSPVASFSNKPGFNWRQIFLTDLSDFHSERHFILLPTPRKHSYLKNAFHR